jgi:hypothetical protein
MAIHFLPFLTVKKNQPVITAKTAPAPAKTTSSFIANAGDTSD